MQGSRRAWWLVLVLAAVTVLGLWLASHEGEVAPAGPAVGPITNDVVTDGAAAEVRQPATEREQAPTPAAPFDDTPLRHPFGYELEVLVQDRTGLPVPGARVLLAPPGCRLDEVEGRTDDSGLLRVQWLGRQASMPIVIGSPRDEVRESIRLITVASGATQRVLLCGRADGGGPSFRLVRGEGQSFTLALDASSSEDFFAALAGGQIGQRGLFGDNPKFGGGLHPFAAFVDQQWAERAKATPEGERGVRLAGQTMTFELGGQGLQLGRADEPATRTPATKLTGTVYGEDGKPSPRCPVVWGRQVDRAAARTQTDESGRFEFDDVPEGVLELRAGGARGGIGHRSVPVTRGQTTDVHVNLRREATVRGRAIGVDDKPLAGWRIEWVGVQQPWTDACTVADDGTFLMTNLAGGVGQMLLFRGDGPSRLPVLVAGSVLPDSGEFVWQFDPAQAEGRLQFEPSLPDGVDKAAVEVRVFQEDTMRGTTMRKAEQGNQFSARGLMAGWYRVEVGGIGVGWTDIGRHFVDGRAVTDLGRVTLSVPGSLRLAAGTAVKAADEQGGQLVEIWRRREDVDVRLDDVQFLAGVAMPVPTGDYFAIWRGETAPRACVPFTVVAGREVVVADPAR